MSGEQSQGDSGQQNGEESKEPQGQTGGAGASGSSPQGNGSGSDDGQGRGSNAQVLADLARERDARQAAETERTALKGQLDELGVFKSGLAQLLGQKEDDLKPEELKRQLSQVQESSSATARELAVFRLASGQGGNPELLADSASFLRSIQGIDPSDTGKMQAAIKEAVEKNSAYRATTPGRGSGDAGAGSGGSSNLSMDDLMRGKR